MQLLNTSIDQRLWAGTYGAHRAGHHHGGHAGRGLSAAMMQQAALQVAATLGAAPAAAPAASSAPATNSDPGTYDVVVMRKQKASLDIVTQEGDRVQISFRTREAAVLQMSAPEGGSVYSFASGRVQIAVQGELNDDELKAIGDLVDKVDALASQFFQGDMQAAFSSAAAIGFDPGQIAGFALRLSLREGVRTNGALPLLPAAATQLAQAPSVDSPSVASPVVAADPVPVPSSAAASATEAAPAAAADSASPAAAGSAVEGSAVDGNTVEPADGAVTGPAKSTDSSSDTSASTSPEQSVQGTLAQFLRHVLGSLAEPSAAGRLEFSMRWKLRIVMAAVESAPQAPAADPAGTKLLGSTLQSLAANPDTALAAPKSTATPTTA